MNLKRLVSALTTALLIFGVSAAAQTAIPAEFRGDWVPAKATCESAVRLRVAAVQLTLINGKDMQSWGNLGVPTSFFGPSYTGISVVAIADFDRSQPFMVYFNEEEKKGVTRVEIYTPIQGRMTAQVAATQAAAKALATRFPLNNIPLKKCASEGRGR